MRALFALWLVCLASADLDSCQENAEASCAKPAIPSAADSNGEDETGLFQVTLEVNHKKIREHKALLQKEVSVPKEEASLSHEATTGKLSVQTNDVAAPEETAASRTETVSVSRNDHLAPRASSSASAKAVKEDAISSRDLLKSDLKDLQQKKNIPAAWKDNMNGDDRLLSEHTLWLLSYPIILVLFVISTYIFFPQFLTLHSTAEAAPDDKCSFVRHSSGSSLNPFTPRADGDGDVPAEEIEGLSFTGALVQLCGIFQGVGLVNVPVVLALCGWPGLVIVGFVILVKGFVGCLVVECMEAPSVDKVGVIRDFAEIGRTSLGFTFVQIVRIMNLLQLVAFASYYMVLVDVSAAPFLADFGIIHDVRAWLVCTVAVVVFPCTFASETNLAWLSFLGNVALMICPALLLASGMMLTEHAATADYIATSAMLDWATGLSIIFGADSGLQVMPHVYEVCRDKRKFHLAFVLAVLITGSVIFFTAWIGYYFYGNHLESCFTLNIGKDLQGNLVENLGAASFAINMGLVFKVLLVFPLLLVQISDSLENVSEYMNIRGSICTFLHRFFTLAGIVVISVFFGTPLISQLATVGCTLTMLTNVCAPVLYYLVLFRSRGVTAKAFAASVVGLLALGFGISILIIEVAMTEPTQAKVSTHDTAQLDDFIPNHGLWALGAARTSIP